MKSLKISLLCFLLALASCRESRRESNGSSEFQNLNITASCSYAGEEKIKDVVGFASDNEAEAALKKIMKFTGLPANFTIKASNVPNACAVIDGQDRYILYSQEFMENIKNQTNTSWAEVSILAHEIGHHLSGHTLQEGGSRPPTELEADKFSGFVLGKMGASLDNALAAMKAISSDEGSDTHPGKSARLAAITNGWKQAKETTSNEPEKETTTGNTAQNEPENNEHENNEDEKVEPIQAEPKKAEPIQVEPIQQERRSRQGQTGRVQGVYPEGSQRYLNADDLSGMSNWELRIMRNEIYARKGYVFSTSEMQGYFEGQSWYRPINDNNAVERSFTAMEKANIALIKSYE